MFQRNSAFISMLKEWFVLVELILSCLAALRAFLQTRGDSALEILALRQQLAVLKRKRPRPQLNRLDRIFWTALHQCWSRWAEALLIVKPRNCRRLAPRRIRPVLALAFPTRRGPA